MNATTIPREFSSGSMVVGGGGGGDEESKGLVEASREQW